MRESQKIFMSVMEKAAEDDTFRAALLADARSAVSKNFDIKVPDSINIVVHENDASTVHLPLPAKPEVLAEGELRKVGGGFQGWSCAGCAACV